MKTNIDNFNPSDVVIATTTCYNDNFPHSVLRSTLAKKTIMTATSFGYNIIVIDGGSPNSLIEEFQELGAEVYPELKRGMGSSRRQAISEAYTTKKPVIAWTEPEKYDYIPEIKLLSQPILHNESDLIIPRRSSMNSYPSSQQLSEPFGNDFWKKLTGTDLDVFFGPRLWKRDLTSLFLDYDGAYGDEWDSIFIPVLDAIGQGKRVSEIKIDYTHPESQKKNEENDLNFYMKRVIQLENLLPAFQSYWAKNNYTKR